MIRLHRLLTTAAFVSVLGLTISGAWLGKDWLAAHQGGTTVVMKTEVITVPQQMAPMPYMPQIRWREYEI